MLNVYMYIIYAYVCIYIYVRVYKVVNFLFVLRPLNYHGNMSQVLMRRHRKK